MTQAPPEFLRIAREMGLLSEDQVEECLQVRQEEIRGTPGGATVSTDESERIRDFVLERGYLHPGQVEAIEERLYKEIGGCRLLSRIGSGGMGKVYRARQISLDKLVAVKILSRDLAGNREFLARFQEEAKLLARLNHRNIVRAIDFGRERGAHYLVMEFVEGRSLYSVAELDGPFEERRALEIAAQVAEGLEHASKCGLVHRDIKPENILLTAEGDVKITDFGLAKSREGSSRAVTTQAGMTFGTPYYMSPEQVRGEELDVRSDLYSLGATLYFLLTGQPPFDAEAEIDIVTAHLETPPPDPRKLAPGVSKNAVRVIRTLMAKERSARYQSPSELALDLARLLAGQDPLRAGKSWTRSRTSDEHRPPGKRSWPKLALASGLGVAAMLPLAYYSWRAARAGREDARVERVAGWADRPATEPGAARTVASPRDDEILALLGAANGSNEEIHAALARLVTILAEEKGSNRAAGIAEARTFLEARLEERANAALPAIETAARTAAEDGGPQEPVLRALGEFAVEFRGTRAAIDANVLAERIARELEVARLAEEAKTGSRTVESPKEAEVSPPRIPEDSTRESPLESWIALAIEKARRREYLDILRDERSPDLAAVHERQAHLAHAQRFVEIASDRALGLAPGARVDLGDTDPVIVVSASRDGIEIQRGESNEVSRIAFSELGPYAIERLVLGLGAPLDAPRMAGYFYAMEGYPREARRFLIEGGLASDQVDAVLAAWKTNEAGFILERPEDREAESLLAAARAHLDEGRPAEAEKALARILSDLAGSLAALERRDQIESLLGAARRARVDLDAFFAGNARTNKEGVVSIQYRLGQGSALADWIVFGSSSTASGVLALTDASAELWKAVWTDFTLTCEYQFASPGELVFSFRREAADRYYQVRVVAKPGANEYVLELGRRIGDDAAVLATQEFARFFPEKGQAFFARGRRIVIECLGATIAVDVNGRRAFEVDDDRLHSGTVAISTSGAKALSTMGISGKLDRTWEDATRALLVARNDLAREAGNAKEIQEGLFGTVYEGKSLEQRIATRTDSTFQFRWPADVAPQDGAPGNAFSIRWRGWIVVPEAGDYEFEARVDDGIRLAVGATPVIDDWKDQSVQTRTGKIHIDRGAHPISIEYYDAANDAVLRLWWRQSGKPNRVLDGRSLFHTPKDRR